MQDLIRTALIGTSNTPHDPVTVTEVDALLPEGSRERRLLWQAGGFAIYRQAGYVSQTARLPTVAPNETMLETPSGITSIIIAAINGELPGLDEWLALRIGAAGRRLPPAVLPSVLDKDATVARWHHVLGERGHWLASQNPKWGARLDKITAQVTADETTLAKIWDEGSTPQRVAALIALRGINADTARELLIATLPKEKAEPRQRLIAALAANLSLDDEPLLERLLDDRAQVVRTTVAQLLARLPASGLVHRMTERAEACLQWQAPMRRSHAPVRRATWGLTVDVPNELPKDWERDGITVVPSHGEGKRASWLRQLVSFVPPAHWSEATGAPVDSLIATMARDEWAEPLLCGCVAAACRADGSDPAWLEALLRHAVSPHNLSAQLKARVPDLLKCVPPKICEDVLCSLFVDGHTDMVMAFARDLGAPWPSALVHAFVAVLSTSGKKSRAREDLMGWYGFASFARLAVLRAADGDLGGLASVLGLVPEIDMLIQARRTVIKEMPL